MVNIKANENMPTKYNSEQFWKLYQGLPRELKDAVSSEETGNIIYDVCIKNKISENLDAVVEYVGQVLVGVLPPADFQETLEKDLGLKKALAKKVTQEINRFIFYPVKPNLEELYRIEIAPPAQMKVTPPASEKPPAAPPGTDKYREGVE